MDETRNLPEGTLTTRDLVETRAEDLKAEILAEHATYEILQKKFYTYKAATLTAICIRGLLVILVWIPVFLHVRLIGKVVAIVLIFTYLNLEALLFFYQTREVAKVIFAGSKGVS